MSRSIVRGFVITCLFILAGLDAGTAVAQEGTVGTVTISVVDQSGGVVSAARLELRDLSTNDVRAAATQDRGNYSFVGLSVGTYQLTVTKAGFEKQVFDSVVVHAAQVTDLSVSLKVGVASETVEVHESETPLIDTTTNAIGTTIDMKQIEDLPLGGRDLSGLANLVPGTSNVPGTGPTWNGLPVMAQGDNIDGVIANTSRMKFAGNYAAPAVSARIEDMSEMTVQTTQMDLNQGFGQSNMQINFVTRRGSNSFHGRAFEDFQNSYLNANSWVNDTFGSVKPHYELNDFGGSIGGPIIKNKLFFFGTYAESKQPGSIIGTNRLLTAVAQAGVFTYTGTDKASHTVCLFTAGCTGGGTGIVDAYNTSNPGANYGSNFPNAVNSVVATEQNNINTAALPLGSVTGTSDPIINAFQWELASPATTYFPTVRVDYNASQTIRFNFAWNMTKYNQPNVNAPTFPGAPFDGQGTGNFTKYYTTAFGFDWTIKPTLVNQFRGGFLYYDQGYGDLGFNNIETQYPTVAWNISSPQTGYPYGGNMAGQQYSLPTPDYYPLFNASDTMTWQHGAHTLSYGFSWYREQDHYWNAPAGYAGYSFGLASGDPALNMFNTTSVPDASGQNLSEIESLYAALAGRISGVGGQFAYSLKTQNYYQQCCSAYNLDELSRSWGLFIQDSWRIKSNLTVNYGLRWDFTGDNHDLTNAYHSVPPSDLFGPSGIGNLFNPGSLPGNNNPEYVANGHAYNPWNITPQPSIGIAWTPGFTDGILGKLAGGGNTVIRAGFSLRDFIEPYQYFWDYATDQGQFYYQNFQLLSGSVGSNPTGYYQPGSLAMTSALNGNQVHAPLPAAPIVTPPAYATTYPMANTTFTFFPAWGMDPNIKQPYTESWNLGIQHQIGHSNALEVRYIGNRAVHQWLGLNINEVNIFAAKGGDPSFLTQFQQAQKNLTLNNALPAGNPYHGTFAYDSAVSGEGPLPIFDAAFTGESGTPLADYGNSQYTTWLNQGQAGALASTLASPFGTTNYYCNLVGAGFGPCANNLGYAGAGAGYPINFFQANPYDEGNSANYLTAGGYSTYNALQVEFRQKQWHGMQFDVNYTWAHNLGLQTRNDWEGSLDNGYTLRNLKLSYAPTLYDLRHTVNASGTYDLPFGVGKQYLNHSGLLDRVVGGWTVGTIFTFQTGSPFSLYGGFNTFNNYGDGGVILTGISPSTIQSHIGVFENGSVTPNLINPAFLTSAFSAGQIAPNSTPGTIAPPIWLHGPKFINDDMAITKYIPIHENLRFSLQGEFLNAFNHPNFAGNGIDNGVQDGGFGTVFGPVNGARAIELRANLEF
jgi:hypothetical protein